ncbi:hypothetical protein ACE1YR_05480 [Pseudomonas sp. K1(2024)]|uniref:DUF3077 domain-containing protein n=1 Tax=Pseudomonas boreofloridensis TaxID=3064348 RepID=A0ABV4Z5G5_9PSED|nr:hypothetical protein [Pseudomonas sp. K13]MDO7903488.1 hypothetical protein [Pseudomonas sp. K13]
MKKSVPDPPDTTRPHPLFTLQPNLPIPDALVHLIQLLRGIEDTLDEFCCANAGAAGTAMLLNAAQSAQLGRLLAEHALADRSG